MIVGFSLVVHRVSIGCSLDVREVSARISLDVDWISSDCRHRGARRAHMSFSPISRGRAGPTLDFWAPAEQSLIDDLAANADLRANAVQEELYPMYVMRVRDLLQLDAWRPHQQLLSDGLLVRVTEVSPDGTSRELTNGILTASLRQVDAARSRYLDGQGKLFRPVTVLLMSQALRATRGDAIDPALVSRVAEEQRMIAMISEPVLACPSPPLRPSPCSPPLRLSEPV